MERLRSARRFCHCVRRGGATPRARGRLSAGVRRTEAQSPGRRRSRPRRERDCRNQSRSHGEHRAPPDARPVAKRARELRDRRDRSSRQRHQSPTAASRLRRSRRRDDCSVRRRQSERGCRVGGAGAVWSARARRPRDWEAARTAQVETRGVTYYSCSWAGRPAGGPGLTPPKPSWIMVVWRLRRMPP
jgi:hypothetical protein